MKKSKRKAANRRLKRLIQRTEKVYNMSVVPYYTRQTILKEVISLY